MKVAVSASSSILISFEVDSCMPQASSLEKTSERTHKTAACALIFSSPGTRKITSAYCPVLYRESKSCPTVAFGTSTLASQVERDALAGSVSSLRSTFISNPTGDSDGDGINNFDELILWRTDPNNSDTNNDGVSDSFAINNGLYASLDYSLPVAQGVIAGIENVQANPSNYSLYTASDVSMAEATARVTGQSDVTSDPSSYSLYTVSDVSIAEASARTAGRNDVTSSPSTYSLHTASELSEAEAAARTLGQADVTSNPSSYNLYTEEYFQSGEAMQQAVEMGRSEVLSSPASFDLYTESDVSEATSAAKTIVNVSARVALGEGEIVTPGFVVLGEQKKMLIRAVGPKLADLGVGSPLPNPTMTVYKSRWDGNPPDLVATIDDWKADNDNVAEIVSAMSSAGAFPLEPTETFQGRPFMTDDTSSAAALVTLDVGVYTVQVSSADDGVGEVLVEVYEITE